jgi:hypothetical protein
MARAVRIALVAVLGWLSFCSIATAQYSLGTISEVTNETCPTIVNGDPADWVTATSGGTDVVTTCYHAEITCSQTTELGVTYGVATPTGASNGMIVFVPSKFGILTLPGNYNGEIPFDLYHDNFQTVQFAFDSEWQITGTGVGSIKVAACRVATIVNFLYTSYFLTNTQNTSTAGMCAHSLSGGAGGLAYAMTYYGAGDYIDKAVFVSGPQYGNLVTGCVPPLEPELNICPSTNGVYAMGCSSSAGTWSDYPSYEQVKTAKDISTELYDDPPCFDTNYNYTQAKQSLLAETSIVDGLSDASYTYPSTAVTAYLCDDDYLWTNPSETQAWYYFSQFSPSSVPATCNYSANNSSTPSSCLMVNRVFGCEQETPADGFICNGSSCPICTGTPPNITCTCGGETCSVQGTPGYAMRPFAEADYLDPVNGCLGRHGAAQRAYSLDNHKLSYG